MIPWDNRIIAQTRKSRTDLVSVLLFSGFQSGLLMFSPLAEWAADLCEIPLKFSESAEKI